MFEISEGTILKSKNHCPMVCVKEVYVEEDGTTIIYTFECGFYAGMINYDYECSHGYTVDEIYKKYDLAGQEFRLFEEHND